MKSIVIAMLVLIVAAPLLAVDSRVPVVQQPGDPVDQFQPTHRDLIVWNNGDADINVLCGNEMTNWLQADDFRVGFDAVLTGVEADWLELSGAGAWDGTIEWTIYLDNAGEPGAVHASGTAPAPIITVPLGTTQGFDWYNSTWNLGQDVFINSGQTYWLGLHFTTSGCASFMGVYWACSVNDNFNDAMESAFCTDPWVQTPYNGEDRAFSVIGDATLPTESASWGALKNMYSE